MYNNYSNIDSTNLYFDYVGNKACVAVYTTNEEHLIAQKSQYGATTQYSGGIEALYLGLLDFYDTITARHEHIKKLTILTHTPNVLNWISSGKAATQYADVFNPCIELLKCIAAKGVTINLQNITKKENKALLKKSNPAVKRILNDALNNTMSLSFLNNNKGDNTIEDTNEYDNGGIS